MKHVYSPTDSRAPAEINRLGKLGIQKNGQTTDVHIKEMPVLAWRIARGAATIEGLMVGTWVAQAIFEKWERHDKTHHSNRPRYR